MLKATLLSGFTELPAEFEKDTLFSCLREVKNLEDQIRVSGREELITVDEVKQIVKLYFKQKAE
ncbi:hypothetical protein BEN47_18875 [Hymenobacter lapidarius]|uniref:Uncharacterized protein n=1 Tax=Hymenobacter lapidarius TaxID=1908237 RepID=A0A1G1STE4_9BACT|nr:hypothetical protein [Hymenobacter lapidarius]OGX81893.1 hypothetical protein BEN47_18875 [Hymenobacter lapidarius]